MSALLQSSQEPLENALLSFLPTGAYEDLLPNLESMHLSLGQCIYEPNEGLEYIYFPTSAVVSLLYTMENGSTAEMGLAGNDGAVGVALFLGGDTMPNRAVAQISGRAIRMHAKVLRKEFARGGPLQH